MILAAAAPVAFQPSTTVVVPRLSLDVPAFTPVMVIIEAEAETRKTIRKRDLILGAFKGFVGSTRREQQEWPMLGGTNKFHPMSGPWPPPPPREIWVPPPGWEPPSKPEVVASEESISSEPAPEKQAWSFTLPDLTSFLGLKKDWPMLGGTNKYHPMAGPWPPPPPRELWVSEAQIPAAEPVVVTSWYDSGVRLATAEEESAATPAPVTSWYDSGVRLAVTDEAAAAAEPSSASEVSDDASGVSPRIRKRDRVVSMMKRFAWAMGGYEPATKDWPMLGGTNKYHPMAGPWPPPPPRELWVAPEGWVPPSKPGASAAAAPAPVTSWYDSGVRLAVTDEAATAAAPISVEAEAIEGVVNADAAEKIAALRAEGEAVVARRLALAQEMAAFKEPVTTASKEVASWYDTGVRLSREAAAESAQAESAGMAPKNLLGSLFDLISKPFGEPAASPAPSAAASTPPVAKTPAKSETPARGVKGAIKRAVKATGLAPPPAFGPPPPGFEWGMLFDADVPATARATSPPAKAVEAAAVAVEAPSPSPPKPRVTKKAAPVTVRKSDLKVGLPPAGFFWGGVY